MLAILLRVRHQDVTLLGKLTYGSYASYAGYAEKCKTGNNIRILTTKFFAHQSAGEYKIPSSGFINLSAPTIDFRK